MGEGKKPDALIVLTPLFSSPEHNVFRIQRENDLEGARVLHIAGGEHSGIVINRLADPFIPVEAEGDVVISYSVWISDGGSPKQEKRTMTFSLQDGVVDVDQGKAVIHAFFREFLNHFPKDYMSFVKTLLKQLHGGYTEIASISVEMRHLRQEELVAIPDAVQYDSSSELEAASSAQVQEVLEHAFPNGLTQETIAEALRCSLEEASEFLRELEAQGIARKVDDEWLRVDTRNVEGMVRSASASGGADRPNVAIISCLFVEKQAVDALLEDSHTIHKYKSGGDSNVYTVGRIGSHHVVATKLALIGDSREATTSAGSITTRLLGNFQHIEHVLITGVGGAVPHYTDAKRHARLGDVVVSTKYIYAHELMVDRHTETFKEFMTRQYCPTDAMIPQIVAECGDELLSRWESLTAEAISRLSSTPEVDFRSPPRNTDVLALPVGSGNVVVVPHPDEGQRTSSLAHVGPVGALATMKKKTNGNGMEAEEQEEETVAQIRERFSCQYGVRAIDAGFDSVVAAVVGSRIDSWALVRGIADYQHGQSRASKLWQAHAATRAAAMARAIIERLPKA